jgi:hypothetical protein
MREFPDTLEQAARRIQERIVAAADELEADAAGIGDDRERETFHLDAAAGARAYAQRLDKALGDEGPVTERTLVEAELVARAADYAGWTTASAVRAIPSDEAAMNNLVDEGVFGYFPQVPGKWVACYRLMAPA